jgi:hypothetical protein
MEETRVRGGITGMGRKLGTKKFEAAWTAVQRNRGTGTRGGENLGHSHPKREIKEGEPVNFL